MQRTVKGSVKGMTSGLSTTLSTIPIYIDIGLIGEENIHYKNYFLVHTLKQRPVKTFFIGRLPDYSHRCQLHVSQQRKQS